MSFIRSCSRVDDYADKIDYLRYNSVMEFSNGFSSSPKQKSRSVVIGSKELVVTWVYFLFF